MIPWWLLGIALAQAPTDEEVVVYGELQVKEARRKLIADFERLGYRKLVERDGRLVLKHETSWKGKVVLFDDGFIDFRRQGVQGTMPDTFFRDASPLIGWVPCVVVPTACVKVGGIVVSKRKLEAVEARTTQSVHGDVEALNARMSDLATDGTVSELPDKLQQCWDEGTPIFDDPSQPHLRDHRSRRLHLLAFWESRTDTVWGDRVREQVAAFLRGVVQQSDDRITVGELEAFRRDSTASRPLSLRSQAPN